MLTHLTKATRLPPASSHKCRSIRWLKKWYDVSLTSWLLNNFWAVDILALAAVSVCCCCWWCICCAICAWYSGNCSNNFLAFVFCVKLLDALISVANESTKCSAAFNCESVSTHNKSSNINTRLDVNILQSDSFFLILMRHRAWLVSLRDRRNFFFKLISQNSIFLHIDIYNRSGVRLASCVELASMRTVCHDSSLNISNSPFWASFKRVKRKSPVNHFGVFDSTRIRDIYAQ